MNYWGGVKLWLNQVQDLNNQSQFGSQQRLNGDEEEENIFDRFAREHENNLNNEGGIRPEDVRIAINAEDLGDVGGAYANGDGNQIEEEHSSSLGDVGGSANPTNPNILAEIPQLLRVNSLGARSQMQQSVINPPQNREIVSKLPSANLLPFTTISVECIFCLPPENKILFMLK